jgi:hypothetical protein
MAFSQLVAETNAVSLLMDPQDQIEVQVKLVSTVRKVHPADLSRSDCLLHQH